jgi:hypothetical protein
MPRPSVGTRPQAESITALAAQIASRMAEVGSSRAAKDDWLQASGLALRSNGLDRAAARVRSLSRPWMLVDEAAPPLSLERAAVIFPGRGARRPGLEAGLVGLEAVRHWFVTRSRRDVHAVLVYWPAEREKLFATVEGLGEAFLWEDILWEDREIEGRLWLALTRRFAAVEGLLR